MSTGKPTFVESINNWIERSITIKLVVIGILIGILMIPVSMIESLIYERQERQTEAINEVSSKWGEEQTITGLVLTIPYKAYTYTNETDAATKITKVKVVESKEYAHFLPELLKVNGNVSPESRYRGIYEVIVYNAKVNLSGNFVIPSFDEWKVDKKDILWEEAYISLGLSDLRSIQENIFVKWDNNNYYFNPGLQSTLVVKNGMNTRLPLQKPDSTKSNYEFSVDLNFNGSSALKFIPLGKITQVGIQSKWANPSFNGAFLPDTREVNADGFTANWEVLHLNRSYPQKFKEKDSVSGFTESSFGVNLFAPVDEYQKSMRSAKYAVLFITLTFLIFFFVQIINKVRIHPIQYIMVGLALCIFYTLLIALSEHIVFKLSYLVSSIAIIGLITLYTKSIIKHTRLTIVIGGILTIIYTFIYIIIQMEDYALLMGSIGLFAVLASIMYLSRKIRWYAVILEQNETPKDTIKKHTEENR